MRPGDAPRANVHRSVDVRERTAIGDDGSVEPDRFHDFFLASAGAAGALIGLLFVAVSVAPERLLGDAAPQGNRIRALSALTAFTNALVVSLFALIAGIDLGWTALAVAAIGLRFVLGSLLSLLNASRPAPGGLRDGTFLVGLVVVFALQLYFGVRMIVDDNPVGAERGLAVLVVVCFLIAISRAWELIGGPDVAVLGELRTLVRRRR